MPFTLEPHLGKVRVGPPPVQETKLMDVIYCKKQYIYVRHYLVAFNASDLCTSCDTSALKAFLLDWRFSCFNLQLLHIVGIWAVFDISHVLH